MVVLREHGKHGVGLDGLPVVYIYRGVLESCTMSVEILDMLSRMDLLNT